jgi:hypothetical protein
VTLQTNKVYFPHLISDPLGPVTTHLRRITTIIKATTVTKSAVVAGRVEHVVALKDGTTEEVSEAEANAVEASVVVEVLMEDAMTVRVGMVVGISRHRHQE